LTAHLTCRARPAAIPARDWGRAPFEAGLSPRPTTHLYRRFRLGPELAFASRHVLVRRFGSRRRPAFRLTVISLLHNLHNLHNDFLAIFALRPCSKRDYGDQILARKNAARHA